MFNEGGFGDGLDRIIGIIERPSSLILQKQILSSGIASFGRINIFIDFGLVERKYVFGGLAMEAFWGVLRLDYAKLRGFGFKRGHCGYWII